MRLKASFRYSIYVAFTVLVLTGAVWLVADWQKDVAGDDMDAFLGETDILVCLLPLTPETRGLLDDAAFARLKPGAALINFARGATYRQLVWEDGRLIRSLSLAPDSGILEDIGEPLPFEAPFWAERQHAPAGDAEAEDPYPLPFHPLELGEAVLLARFGYQLEGGGDASVDPFSIPLLHFQRSGMRRKVAPEEPEASAPWWKFW